MTHAAPRSLLALLAAALALVSGRAQSREDDRPVESRPARAGETRANPTLPTLYLIGDSTVKVGTLGQRGWGEELAAFFDRSRINVVNRAIGGRSSRTFLTDGRWEPIVADLRAGDFVLIQFGHNDGGPVNDDFRARGTLRGIGEETEAIDNLLTKRPEVVHTYGWYLRKYVRDTQSAGATPIVCSLVPRKVWQERRIARGRDTYAGWAEQVARQTGALFLDLHEIIARGYEKLGPAAVEPFFADERTHTSVAGAQFSAAAVVSGLKALPGNPLEPYFSPAGRAVPAYEP